MKKSTLMILVAAVATAALIALAGCSGNQGGSDDQKPADQSSAPAAAAPAETSPAPAAAPAETSPAAEPAPAPAPAPAQTQDGYIGEEAAKDIALQHAGVAEADIFDLELKLDTDDAVVHYDVDFKANGMEYDYDIDPVTGDILKGEAEVDD